MIARASGYWNGWKIATARGSPGSFSRRACPAASRSRTSSGRRPSAPYGTFAGSTATTRACLSRSSAWSRRMNCSSVRGRSRTRSGSVSGTARTLPPALGGGDLGVLRRNPGERGGRLRHLVPAAVVAADDVVALGDLLAVHVRRLGQGLALAQLPAAELGACRLGAGVVLLRLGGTGQRRRLRGGEPDRRRRPHEVDDLHPLAVLVAHRVDLACVLRVGPGRVLHRPDRARLALHLARRVLLLVGLRASRARERDGDSENTSCPDPHLPLPPRTSMIGTPRILGPGAARVRRGRDTRTARGGTVGTTH